jgi:hypothetical protein
VRRLPPATTETNRIQFVLFATQNRSLGDRILVTAVESSIQQRAASRVLQREMLGGGGLVATSPSVRPSVRPSVAAPDADAVPTPRSVYQSPVARPPAVLLLQGRRSPRAS